MSLATGICWVAWVYIVMSIDPSDAGMAGLGFFYVSLFLALTGTISVIGFVIRSRLVKNDSTVFHHVKRTFRQGAIIAVSAILALFLLQWRVLAWYSGLVLVFLVAGLESVIFSRRRFGNNDLKKFRA